MPEHDQDAEGVQLPHGTDVITSVDREASGETIASGSVGRVVGTSVDAVDVQILGIGIVRYLRSEVAPFRSGQVRYALARDAAWNALHHNIVLETTVGSHAWGLAESHSDVDRRGMFVLPFSWTARLGSAPEDLISADGSSTHWEAAKVINQALRADPNTLEMLFVPGAKALDPIGAWMLDARDAFASARIHASFGQYALSQLKKLRRSMRLTEHREIVLAWLREDPKLSLDAAAMRLCESAEIIAPSEADRHAMAKEHLKQLYVSLFDQGILQERNFDALRAYAFTEPDFSELPRRLRPKNAYNLLRLLITATGWLRTGTPTFEMVGHERAELLAIKRGETDLEAVLRRADFLSKDLDDAHRTTKLPERPNLDHAQQLLLRIREEAGRRWLHRVPGPFGTDASVVPLPEWRA
jgi:hypothetical protein